MKYIEKREQPEELTRWIANTSNPNYKNFTKKTIKKKTRKKLLEDQGYICCYCQKRLVEYPKGGNVEIEHIKPQSKCTNIETVSYDNLLVSCDGNQRKNNDLLDDNDRHCNNYRQDKSLCINLLDEDCEKKIYYDFYGGIYAVNDDTKVEKTIKNLNLRILNSTRKAYIEGFALENCSDEELNHFKNYFNNKNEEDGKQMYPEYAGVMINLLNQLG